MLVTKPIAFPRIAIAGGGPAGLALGLLLHRCGIPTHIYDLRRPLTKQELSQPSGSLDLHAESGLAVMRACGLWDEFQAAAGTDCSQAMRVMDKHAKLLHADEGELSDRPEIARNALMGLLSQHVPVNSLRWHHKIRAAWQGEEKEETGVTQTTLDFGGEHPRATYDFVVGADGAWSKVRPLVSHIKPMYSGAQWFTATVRQATTRFPHLAQLSGTGSLSALGDGHGILAQRASDGALRVYATVRTADEDWAAKVGLVGVPNNQAKEALLLNPDSPFYDWGAPLKELLAAACDDEARLYPANSPDIKGLFMLPVGHKWQHQPGVTLIGDAAHLMTPWAGEGVNQALWDALDLSRAIVAAFEETGTSSEIDVATWQAALDVHIGAFEAQMLARAEEKAIETKANMDLFTSDNGAQAMADFFKQAGYA